MQRLGVKTRWGEAGTFKQPLLSEDGLSCIGALMEDGSEIMADRVIMCAGAWLPSYVFSPISISCKFD